MNKHPHLNFDEADIEDAEIIEPDEVELIDDNNEPPHPALINNMLVPQGGSLDSYIRMANQYPILTADQERELAERFYYDEDLDAAKQLIM